MCLTVFRSRLFHSVTLSECDQPRSGWPPPSKGPYSLICRTNGKHSSSASWAASQGPSTSGMANNLHKRVFQHKFHRIEGFADKYQVERLFYWEPFDDV